MSRSVQAKGTFSSKTHQSDPVPADEGELSHTPISIQNGFVECGHQFLGHFDLHAPKVEEHAVVHHLKAFVLGGLHSGVSVIVYGRGEEQLEAAGVRHLRLGDRRLVLKGVAGSIG